MVIKKDRPHIVEITSFDSIEEKEGVLAFARKQEEFKRCMSESPGYIPKLLVFAGGEVEANVLKSKIEKEFA